ncbi:Hypothetical protein POVN_LOCUS218 [uncultured virus]|nr:Hypothetical protein POVN_LOCUS218 [uncultured virus]
MTSQNNARALVRTVGEVTRWAAKYKIPADHGMSHYARVLGYAKQAKLAGCTDKQKLAVYLAALLHDVDDRKIKKYLTAVLDALKVQSDEKLSLPLEAAIGVLEDPAVKAQRQAAKLDAAFAEATGIPTQIVAGQQAPVEVKKEEKKVSLSEKYPIAASFLDAHGDTSVLRDLVLEMIDLVSASQNGNRTVKDKWKLVPRDADRLDALGKTGVQRCYDYTRSVGNPLCCADTPLAVNETQLTLIMKGRTLEDYVKGGGKSASMMDHFTDKLFHLGTMASEDVNLQRIADREMEPLKAFFFRTARVLRLIKITTPLQFSGVELELSAVEPESPTDYCDNEDES